MGMSGPRAPLSGLIGDDGTDPEAPPCGAAAPPLLPVAPPSEPPASEASAFSPAPERKVKGITFFPEIQEVLE